MNSLPMGLVLDMPFDQYLAVDAMSQTGLKQLARSPWHYRNRQPMRQTRSMFTGTLAHCAVLEGDALASRYIVTPEDAPRRPTEAQWSAKNPNDSSRAAMAWWSEFNRQAFGREIVSADEYAITQQQVQAVAAVPELAAILADGHAEASVFWVDPETGIYCKARPDFVHTLPDGRAVLLDLKTTVDESPEGFRRTVARFQYQTQDAHYRAGWEQATGQQVAEFIFGAVSSAPPVLAVPYRLDENAAAAGATLRRDLLAAYAESLNTGNWPAYGPGVLTLSLPPWCMPSQEVEFSFVEEEPHA